MLKSNQDVAGNEPAKAAELASDFSNSSNIHAAVRPHARQQKHEEIATTNSKEEPLSKKIKKEEAVRAGNDPSGVSFGTVYHFGSQSSEVLADSRYSRPVQMQMQMPMQSFPTLATNSQPYVPTLPNFYGMQPMMPPFRLFPNPGMIPFGAPAPIATMVNPFPNSYGMQSVPPLTDFSDSVNHSLGLQQRAQPFMSSVHPFAFSSSGLAALPVNDQIEPNDFTHASLPRLIDPWALFDVIEQQRIVSENSVIKLCIARAKAGLNKSEDSVHVLVFVICLDLHRTSLDDGTLKSFFKLLSDYNFGYIARLAEFFHDYPPPRDAATQSSIFFELDSHSNGSKSISTMLKQISKLLSTKLKVAFHISFREIFYTEAPAFNKRKRDYQEARDYQDSNVASSLATAKWVGDFFGASENKPSFADATDGLNEKPQASVTELKK